MKVLDLYCGAGGATYGYQLAGCKVTGIDSLEQPRYVGDDFIKRNALGVPVEFIREFDLVHASPPCQHYMPMAQQSYSPDLIAPTRHLLNKAGVPYVIENIMSAPISKWILLCGTMFLVLRVIRHRKFEPSPDLCGVIKQPDHIPKDEHPRVYSFDRRARRLQGLNEDENFITVAGNNASLGAMSDAMGIWWMTRPEITQSIPPLYTKYIATQVMAQRPVAAV